jgi:hypothetical protein
MTKVKLKVSNINDKMQKKTVWNFIKDNYEEGHMLCISKYTLVNKDKNPKKGFFKNAFRRNKKQSDDIYKREDYYSIMDIHESNEKKNIIKAVNVRNPWGKHHLASKNGFFDEIDKKDGSFWVDIDTLIKDWNNIYLCKTFSQDNLINVYEGKWNTLDNKTIKLDLDKIKQNLPKTGSLSRSKTLTRYNSANMAKTNTNDKYYIEKDSSYKINVANRCSIDITLERIGRFNKSLGLVVYKGNPSVIKNNICYSQLPVEGQDHVACNISFKPGIYYIKICGDSGNSDYHMCVFGDDEETVRFTRLK